MSYNGWNNYPTWNVALWLDNEQGTSYDVRELAEDADDKYELAGNLKSYVESLVEATAPEVYGASFVADLFGYAMDQVDWDELADHYYDDAHEDDEAS